MMPHVISCLNTSILREIKQILQAPGNIVRGRSRRWSITSILANILRVSEVSLELHTVLELELLQV